MKLLLRVLVYHKNLSSESTQLGADGQCKCKTFLGPVQKLRGSHTNTAALLYI